MRRVKQLLLGLGALLLLLVALLGLTIIVDGIGAGARLASLTNTAIPGPAGGEVRAYVARPEGAGPFPAVLMIHEFWGLNTSLRDKADALAAEGYVVIAPDTFRGSQARWVPRAIFQVLTTPTERANQDLAAAFAWAAAQPDVDGTRIVAMGFCYGGGAALRYSLSEPALAGTAILYGSPIVEPEPLRALPGPLLGIFGGADNSIPVSEVRAFEAALAEAGVPHEVTIYDGQPHAFITSVEAIRAGGAPGEAWAELLAFLDATLGASAQGLRAPAPAVALRGPDWRYALWLAYEHALGSASHDH